MLGRFLICHEFEPQPGHVAFVESDHDLISIFFLPLIQRRAVVGYWRKYMYVLSVLVLGTYLNNLKIYASEIWHPAFENSRFDLTESIYHFIFVFCDQSRYMFANCVCKKGQVKVNLCPGMVFQERILF